MLTPFAVPTKQVDFTMDPHALANALLESLVQCGEKMANKARTLECVQALIDYEAGLTYSQESAGFDFDVLFEFIS